MPSEPNIYVCSTVRHLLFALLRANSLAGESHYILFFSDYQNAALTGWNLRHLPANISVFDVARSRFRAHLGGSPRGRLCYFMAMRNWRAPGALKAPLRALLAEAAPALPGVAGDGASPQLWLFNERNKMARLLRLLIPRFALIEDGESNYRVLVCPWWKWPDRLLRGLPPRARALGEESRCTAIWALEPGRLPARVRHKGQRIDFLDQPGAVQFVDGLFGECAGVTRDARRIILATQPFRIPGVNLADKQRVYDRIVHYLAALGRPVVLKPHPAEDPGDYDFLEGRVARVPGKIPIEVMLIGNAEPVTVLSVLSSAGMGFERYCRRLKLCEDSPSNALYLQTVRSWIADPQRLDEVLRQKLPA